jgi:hypothetical protein
VTGYEPLIPELTNDPKDRHVLAAAVHAHAQIILTFNLKDFPASALGPHGIVAAHPDDFLIRLYTEQAEVVQRMVRDQAAALVRPPLSVTEVIDTLAQHVPTFAARLSSALNAEDASSVP